jgi:hypothetical protein
MLSRETKHHPFLVHAILLKDPAVYFQAFFHTYPAKMNLKLSVSGIWTVLPDRIHAGERAIQELIQAVSGTKYRQRVVIVRAAFQLRDI